MNRTMAGAALVLVALLGLSSMSLAANEPQVLVRFECKQLLLWEPLTGRYCFDDRTQRFCSSDTYESNMWHHAMYTVNATGFGHLMVDGVVQSLVTPNNYDDASAGYTAYSGGNTFSTQMSPTTCNSGFQGPEGSAGGSCCSTRIGQQCDASMTGFEGLIDEVGIWDRSVEGEQEAQLVMFAMPKGLPTPVDSSVTCLEEKRVLYARWNTECQSATAVVDPTGTCEGSSRLKTQRVTYVGDGKLGFTTAPWSPPAVLGMTMNGNPLDTVPMDGGDVTIYGVGFAASQFLKCVVKSPDHMGWLQAGDLFFQSNDHNIEASSKDTVTTVDAAALTASYADMPYLGRWDYRHPGNNNTGVMWGVEAVTCTLPAMPFPSDQYYVGVTNDLNTDTTDKLTGSPATAMTTMVMDYALALPPSDVTVDVAALSGNAASLDNSAFTLSMWIKTFAESRDLVKLNSNVVVVRTERTRLSVTLQGAASSATVTLVENGEWHHVMIAADGSGTITATIDLAAAVTTTSADTTCSPLVVGSAGPLSQVLLDEVKVYTTALSASDYLANMYHLKETTGSPAAVMLRFTEMNTGAFVNSKTGTTAAASATLSLVATSVPWEPTAIYKVNGAPFSKWNTYTVETGASQTLDIEGFNFAKSPFTKCYFSEPTSSPVPAAYKTTTVASQLPVFSFADGRSLQWESDTNVKCTVSASSDAAAGSHFAATSFYTHSYGLFGYAGRSLQCGDGGYATTAELGKLIASPTDSTQGYTVSLWVMPADGAVDGAVTTVLSIEDLPGNPVNGAYKGEGWSKQSVAGGMKRAMVLYDGKDLFYYDECVKEQRVPGFGHRAGEWHFVSFTVNPEDMATFTVDMDSTSFYSGSRPHPESVVTLCADMKTDGGAPRAGGFFAGLVDEVMFFSSNETASSTRCKAAADAPHSMVAHASFNSAGASSTLGPAFTLVNASMAPATAPWLPAKVYYVNDREPNCEDCGTTDMLHIHGTNLAPSPFLHLKYESANGDYDMVQYATNGKDSGVLARAKCEQGTFEVAAYNCYAPGDQIDFTLQGTSVTNSGQFTYDVASTVAAHWTLDVSAAAPDGAAVYTEATGTGLEFSAPMEAATADRNHFDFAALRLTPEMDPVTVPVPAVLENADASASGFTVSVLANVDITHETSAFDKAAFGGWKVLSYVRTQTSEKVYANDVEADSPLLLAHMQALVANGTLFAGLAATVDDIWVYGRGLTTCELLQRSKTWAYALDVSTETATVSPVPVPAGMVFTLESWVYPMSTDGMQTMFAVQGATEGNTTAPSPFAFFLHDNCLAVSIHAGCAAEPCSSYKEGVAHAAVVTVNEWTHVAVSFDGATAYFYVNGCFKGSADLGPVVFPGGDVTMLIGDETVPALDTYMGLFAEPTIRKFNGLVADLRVSPGAKDHRDVAEAARVCNVRSAWTPGTGSMYLRLNEGSGLVAGDGKVTLPSELMWKDYTAALVSDTDLGMTMVQGNLFAFGNTTGQYVVTAYDECGRQAIAGGEDFKVVMTKGTFSGEASVVDSGDGNYHVYYNRETLDGCGDYASVLTRGTDTVAAYNVAIMPLPADEAQTYVMPPPANRGVNTPHQLVIQTVDANGCSGNYTDDVFEVNITGAEELQATVVPGPELGQYTAYWIPRSPGTYHVTVTMLSGPSGSAVVKDGYLCVEVGMGSVFTFAGDDSLLIDESTISDGPAGLTALDLAIPEFTIATWVQFTSLSADAYLAFKGDASQVGNQFFKGYYLKYDVTLGTFAVEIYGGDARFRRFNMSEIANTVQTGTWMHVAVSYDGTTFKGYLNGALVSQQSFGSALAPAPNYYYHPLMLGFGLVGSMDDFAIWSTLRTEEDFEAEVSCGTLFDGQEQAANLVAYYSFNDDYAALPDGSVRGVGASCWMNPDPLCLAAMYTNGNPASPSMATVRQTEAHPTLEDTNLRKTDYSRSYAGESNPPFAVNGASGWFPVYLYSQCGFLLTHPASVTPVHDVVLTLTSVADGSTYPETLSTPSPLACPSLPEMPDVKNRLGGVYNGTTPVTKAGDYTMAVTVDGNPIKDAFAGEPVSIVNDVPVKFNVLSTPSAMESGESTDFTLQLLDQYDNVVQQEMGVFALTFTLVGASYGKAYVYYAADSANFVDGTYTFNVSICRTGNYVLDIVAEYAYNLPPVSFELKVTGGQWATLSESSPARFHHAGVAYAGDLYLFGGVLADKTYSDDLLWAPGMAGAVVPAGVQWQPVPAERSFYRPTARASHSAVEYGGKMWIFGGARAGKVFNELHSLTLNGVEGAEPFTWQFVEDGMQPPPRYDHSAAVVGNTMVVYGGRNTTHQFINEVWVFDFTTMLWSLRELSMPEHMAGRYGHSASAPAGGSRMYVFGGYSDVGVSRDFFMCDLSMGLCLDYTYGCSPGVGADHMEVPEALTARFSHTAHVDDRFIYIYGGTNVTDPVGYSDIFTFSYQSCVWMQQPVTGAPMGRYDHYSWLTQGGLVVQGGKFDQEYLEGTLYMPLC